MKSKMIFILVNSQECKVGEVGQDNKKKYKPSTPAKWTSLYKYNGLIT